MIQSVFLLPILYIIVLKYDFAGFLLLFGITGLYEAFIDCIGMGDSLYKYIIFRYVSVLAFGIFIAVGKKQLKSAGLAIFYVLGVIWQTALNYIPLSPHFMNNTWARVNYLSSIPAMVFVYAIVKTGIHGIMSELHVPCLSAIGKASYNIFLIQMLVYGCGVSTFVYRISGELMQLFVLLLICTICGVAFFRVENRATSYILSRLDNKWREK